MNALATMAALIEQRTGMEIATLGSDAALESTMAYCTKAAGFGTTDEWLAQLPHQGSLWESFLHRVIVPETFFFRYPESFAALTSWVQQNGRKPLRILSIPCSTGEEAYSIAITLHRIGFREKDFLVTGMDINAPSVQWAKAGSYYRSSTLRGLSAETESEFFLTEGKNVTVLESIRRSTRFEVRNFWDASSPSEPYDIIFCRNLLIYFPPQRQAQALEKLGAWLRPDGALFLGPAEMPLAGNMGWVPLGYPMSFACSYSSPNSAKGRGKPAFTPFHRPAHLHVPSVTVSIPLAPPAPVSVSAPAPQVPTLSEIQLMADRGEVEGASQALEQYMKLSAPNADAYVLAGLLQEMSGSLADAEAHFRKALYLSPQHPQALSHLALLLQAAGRGEASRKLLARAERLHSSSSSP